MPDLKRDRPTIGVLAGWAITTGRISDRYLVSIFRGIQSAARLKECHLLLAWGLGRVSGSGGIFPAWPVRSSSSDFVPVGPWNMDGLIVIGSLHNEDRSMYIQQLRDQGYPALFICTGEKEPMISVDNEGGIRKAVEHLVSHGHRDIAFISGNPKSQGDSGLRLRGYHAAVAKLGLNTDPRLVEPGWHDFTQGYEAARKIINSGVRVTAMVASDDSSAIGVMQAIHDAGLRIPGDIAVIGFDDQPDAMAQVPPLTSVHVPLPEMGEQALLVMMDHLTGRHPLESLCVPARLTLRQSCGCIPEVVSSAADRQARLPAVNVRPGKPDSIPQIKHKLVEEMVAVLPAEARIADGEQTRRICAGLVDAFYKSLKKGSPAVYRDPLMEFLRRLEVSGGSIDPWQEIISVLRREMTVLPLNWEHVETRLLAEDLLHQARAAISESAQRRDYRNQYTQDSISQALSELTAALSIILDERQAVEFLEKHLADVNVRHARVALFQPEGDDPIAWSLTSGPDLDSPGYRFPTRDFPPPGLYPADELLNLALVPLVFQNEPLGYVAFDGSNPDSYALIVRQLAATFKTAQLYAQVTQLSLTDALTGLHNRRYFDIFLKNEVERSRRFGNKLAVLILDIDHFKNYNDAFGHPAGDRALQFLAGCIRESHRSADAAARIGGEEFAIILPDAELTGAFRVARKVRAAVTRASDLARPITLSVGISIVKRKDIQAEVLVRQADMALYEAKRRGRDRICVFLKDGEFSEET